MDINTATSSTMTSTEASVGTKTQRINKSDISFQEEMNKFNVEVDENSEVASNKIEKAEKTEISKNNNKPLGEKSKIVTETVSEPVDIKMVSTTKPAKHNAGLQQNNNIQSETPVFVSTTQLAQQNAAQIVITDKQNKPQNAENKDTKNNPIKEIVTQQITIEKQTENNIKDTKEIKTTKRVTEKISDKSIKENIIEQTQQIISEVTTNANQNIQVAQSAATTPQAAPVIDTMQTLIEANKQLANITLLTDAKVVETKVTTKASKESIKVDYTTVKMTTEDAVFFADLVQDTEKTLQNVVADLQSEAEQKVQEASKNVKVSATLMNAISEAAKTNQPMRIDFDKDVSIIIKIDKDGAVNAKFIPGDKAVEEYLKQNISALRQRFDEQDLNYRDLSYSNRQKQNQEQNRRNNKERDHE